MYPSNYRSLLPPFPRRNRVFVAMSFDPRFDGGWTNVIQPAIERIEVDDTRLTAFRVDTRKVSDSVITEIIDGIGNDLLVLADLTTIGMLGDRPVRNSNVMYEVGIAHAARVPEEVLLFRSDADAKLFDLANIRVRSYDPDSDPEGAREEITTAIADALREVKLVSHMAVEKAAKSLDFASWNILLFAQGVVRPPQLRTMRDVMNNISTLPAITRLLEIGALQTRYSKLHDPATGNLKLAMPMEDTMSYDLTKFGQAIIGYGAGEMGITLELLERLHTEGALDDATPAAKDDT